MMRCEKDLSQLDDVRVVQSAVVDQLAVDVVADLYDRVEVACKLSAP